jgi:hypothetical protein
MTRADNERIAALESELHQLRSEIADMRQDVKSLVGDRNKAFGFILFAAALTGGIASKILFAIQSIFSHN